MSAEEITLRVARPEDAKALLTIYAPYVRDTAITFEYDVPSVEEFAGRIAHTLEFYPYLVAQKGEEILGYAYVGRFKERRAYDWAVESSVYIAQNARRMGLGKRLYAALEDILRAQGIRNLCACITCTDHPDAHQDNNSMQFHAHLGFRLVGRFEKCGCKFGAWYDMVWMEKHLASHPDNPAPVVPFSQVREKFGL